MQVFSCEFQEISKNTLLYRTPLVAASEHTIKVLMIYFFAWFHYFTILKNYILAQHNWKILVDLISSKV